MLNGRNLLAAVSQNHNYSRHLVFYLRGYWLREPLV
jgi:hypothetical protein